MSIFDRSSVEAVAIQRFSREMCGHHRDGWKRGGRARWEAASETVRMSWLQSAATDLAAAEVALDREALAIGLARRRASAGVWETAHEESRRVWIARARGDIDTLLDSSEAALFPTEGGADA